MHRRQRPGNRGHFGHFKLKLLSDINYFVLGGGRSRREPVSGAKFPARREFAGKIDQFCFRGTTSRPGLPLNLGPNRINSLLRMAGNFLSRAGNWERPAANWNASGCPEAHWQIAEPRGEALVSFPAGAHLVQPAD
jgi:hypothetical protein